jgi:uncharacterized protein YaaW (UPF0174 family)
MSYKQIVEKILDNVIIEVNKRENIDKIKKNIIEPIIHNTVYEMYPYIIIFIITMIVLLLLVFSILFLNLRACYN